MINNTSIGIWMSVFTYGYDGFKISAMIRQHICKRRHVGHVDLLGTECFDESGVISCKNDLHLHSKFLLQILFYACIPSLNSSGLRQQRLQ